MSGFDPSLCATLACIQSFGLGYNLTIGDEIIAFYGSVNIPNFWDIFLESQLSDGHGMALRFVDICVEWNELIGNEIGIPIDISDIPTDWGFDATYIYIAPVAGTFGGISYRQGFWIDSGFNMFGLSVLVNIEV